jgi:hypothetical protein
MRLLILGLFTASLSFSGVLDRFLALKPNFDTAMVKMWGDFYRPSLFAGDIEQESNWKSKAHLHTSVEDGWGLGQVTQTYNAKTHKENMNVFEDLKHRNPQAFAGWNYKENPFDVDYQLKSALFLHHINYNSVAHYFSDQDSKAKAMFTAYNCGAGMVIWDVSLCKKLGGKCDVWDEGVALNSHLSKTPKTAEYKDSPFTINRQYAPLIYQRAVKYQKWYK